MIHKQQGISTHDKPKLKSEDLGDYGSSMPRNIDSSFQLAKMIVSKVEHTDNGKRKVILVADDEPLTFELINEFFNDANLGYQILKADTGRRAYHLAATEVPDLIITDWIMPEFDGPDLIRKLNGNPATKNIPVIMTTGAVFPDHELNRVLTSGAIDYLPKPIDEKELIARVKTALALTRSEERRVGKECRL